MVVLCLTTYPSTPHLLTFPLHHSLLCPFIHLTSIISSHPPRAPQTSLPKTDRHLQLPDPVLNLSTGQLIWLWRYWIILISSLSVTVVGSMSQCFFTLIDGEALARSHRWNKWRPRIKHTHHARDVIIYAPFGHSSWLLNVASLVNSLLIFQWSK